MTAFWLYIFKVSIALIVFYLFYFVVLKNSTYFVLNRIYLICSLLLSFIIPVLKFSIFTGQSNVVFETFNIDLIEPDLPFFQPQTITNEINTINYPVILSAIYFAGISILFFRLLFSIIRIIRIRQNAETRSFERIKIVQVDSNVPFSFFKTVYLPKGENNTLIVRHEIAHIRQYHWIDLFISETASAVLWFNPFIIFYKRAIRLQHEYLADKAAVINKFHIEDYLGCMLQQVQNVSSMRLISQFYCKTIKKRIIMITKNKTSIRFLGLYLMVIPLVCMLLFAFSGKNSSPVITDNGVISISEGDNIPSIYPIDKDKIKQTRGYGESVNPFTKKEEFHFGIDIAAKEGVEIMATADGVVIEATFDTENKKGNYIVIRHSDVYSTFYCHMKSISVKKGDTVEKGQEIGFVGNTGVSTGPHLHYEVIKNGERVNPKDYLPQ